MPGEDITSWSKIAANNATADTLIDWREGQARASVNDSERSVMAAHAKDRDLKNGSITTGGIANAQTFTSGVGYTGTVPTGLRATLKVGASLTNTASMTLNMDGIGNITVKNQRGSDLGGGEWLAGSLVDVIYNGTNWILQTEQNISGAILNAGRLQYVSGTEIRFVPFNGDRIKINGAVYPIPAAGISIANTNVNVNAVPASNLAANTTYLVALFSSSLTPMFLSGNVHAPSATAGNVGTEVVGASDVLSLIGIVRTGVGGIFVDSAAQRFVASWFNPVNRTLQGASISGGHGSTTPLEIGSNYRVEWVQFTGRPGQVTFQGSAYNNVQNYHTYSTIGLDGTLTGITDIADAAALSDNYGMPFHCSYVCSGLADGYHYAMAVGMVTGNVGNWIGTLRGSIG
jgi:hypothetical protein